MLRKRLLEGLPVPGQLPPGSSPQHAGAKQYRKQHVAGGKKKK